jgi:hypothetical protein
MGNANVSYKPALLSNFQLGQTVTTILTPNSTSIATPLPNDLSQTTLVKFDVQSVSYWTTLVSNSTLQATLLANKGNSLVTFMKGLTVSFNAQGGGTYVVLLDGEIIDDETSYPMVGKPLGIFSSTTLVGSVMRLT